MGHLDPTAYPLSHSANITFARIIEWHVFFDSQCSVSTIYRLLVLVTLDDVLVATVATVRENVTTLHETLRTSAMLLQRFIQLVHSIM